MKDYAASWERLLHVLEWVLDVKLRHAEAIPFSMVYISFGDKATLGNRYGAVVAYQLLVEFADDLKRALRKSDIIARDGTDFWLMLPHIEGELIVPKLSRIVEISAENGLDIVARDISIFAFPDNSFMKQHNLNAPLPFLEYLKNNRVIAKGWSGETA